MRVLKIEPGKAPITINIENTLESLQGQVGGYIETVTFDEDVVIICDEEGRLKDKPYNFRLCGMDFVGVILIAGRKDDGFCDIKDVNARWFCQWWRTLRRGPLHESDGSCHGKNARSPAGLRRSPKGLDDCILSRE